MKLTKEEREILDSVERGDWKRIDGFAAAKRRIESAARATHRKDKRVNLRMTERDYQLFQRRAAEEGLPCQTLMSSVLHKFINRPRTDPA